MKKSFAPKALDIARTALTITAIVILAAFIVTFETAKGAAAGFMNGIRSLSGRTSIPRVKLSI